MEEHDKKRGRFKLLMSRPWGKRIATVVVIAAIIAIIAGIRYVNFLKEEKYQAEMNYHMKIDWFCLDECEDMLRETDQFNICEEHNTEVMQKVEAWNQNGLRSFMDWDEKVYPVLKQSIAEDEHGTETEKRNALLLIDGGADILNMDYEEFEDAVRYIEWRGADSSETTNIVELGGIKWQWQETVR